MNTGESENEGVHVSTRVETQSTAHKYSRKLATVTLVMMPGRGKGRGRRSEIMSARVEARRKGCIEPREPDARRPDEWCSDSR